MKVLKKFLKIFIVLSLLFSFQLGIAVEALSFIENNNTNFNGTFKNTAYNNTQLGVGLNASGNSCTNFGVSTNCDYTSEVKNAGNDSTWNSFSFTPKAPYYKELPNNNAAEAGYEQHNLNMQGNIALWHLNETANNPTSFLDSSGNNFHLTCSTATTCPVPSSNLAFNSSRITSATNYFNAPSGFSVKGLSEFSVSFLAKDLQPTLASRVLMQEPTANNTSPRWAIRITPLGQLVFEGRTTNGGGLTTTFISRPTPGAGDHHIVVVFNANTDVHTMYINGVKYTNTVTVTTMPNTNPSTNFKIGVNSNNGSPFSGSIDEIAVFNRSLSDSEIEGIFQRTILRNLIFQVRTCDDVNCNGENFLGPDGSSSTYFKDENGSLSIPVFNLNQSFFPANKYFQFRVYFSAPNVALSPILKSVSVNYNLDQSLAFNIRDSQDVANINTCNLGEVKVTATATCSYRLKISSSLSSGYRIYVNTNSGLKSVNYTITDALPGNGGAQGDIINNGSLGVQKYGAIINKGTATSGANVNLNAIFNAGNKNVKYNYNNKEEVLFVNGKNLPNQNDLNNTILITHNLNISNETRAGNYTQNITYTVVPEF